MLTIHGVPRSRAFRCLWAAEEAGIPYRHVPTPLGPGLKAADHLRLNPNGKLPAMTDGDLALFESLAINLHIAAKVGAPFMPAGDDASRALQWTLWAATEAEPHGMQWALNTYMRPEAERDPAQAAAGAAALRARLAMLDGHLAADARPHLLGAAFTVADCNLAGVLYAGWFNGFDYAPVPAAKAWLDRCLERPAARKARAMREGAAG